jgi:hypothetical protein
MRVPGSGRVLALLFAVGLHYNDPGPVLPGREEFDSGSVCPECAKFGVTTIVRVGPGTANPFFCSGRPPHKLELVPPGKFRVAEE